ARFPAQRWPDSRPDLVSSARRRKKMVVSWQVLAAVAAVFVLVWTRMFASLGRLRVLAVAAAALLIANAVVHEQGWFSSYQYGTAEAELAARPDPAGRPRPTQAPPPQGGWT